MKSSKFFRCTHVAETWETELEWSLGILAAWMRKDEERLTPDQRLYLYVPLEGKVCRLPDLTRHFLGGIYRQPNPIAMLR